MKVLCDFTKSTVGKKIIVATTGVILIGFLFFHLLGNLQIFAGRGETIETTKINMYSAFLRKEMALLWAARIVLLIAAIVHIYFTVLLTIENKKSRPQPYVIRNTYSTAASRTMFYGGLFVLFYIVYHLLHFTFGAINKSVLQPGDLYQSMILSFQRLDISTVYILGQLALFMHLYHGSFSLFRTLGVTNPVHLAWIQKATFGFSFLICAGFISIPIAVLLGCVR